MRQWPAAVPLMLLLIGCAAAPPASNNAASSSPTEASPAEPSPTPSAASGGPYAVLVDLLSHSDTYDVSVVARDGKVVARVGAVKRTGWTNATGTALDLPYVSTTSTALYFLDGGSNNVLRLRLADMPNTSIVTKLAVGRGMEGAFAVSPDDTKIAVTVLDFTSNPAHLQLYVDNLTGGDKHVIFDSFSDYVWPVAWHAGLLVLAHAYGPYLEDVTKAAPGRDNPYWAISYHLVDPATANRVTLMGSCTPSGPLSPAGSACIQGESIDWSGNATSWGTHDWGSISAAASISPDGSLIAAARPDAQESVAFWRPGGAVATWVDGSGAQEWAGWLDNTHVVIASATSQDFQPRVVTLSQGPSPAQFIDARGFYAARLPTDIT